MRNYYTRMNKITSS